MPAARHAGVELLLDATRSARRRAWSPSPGAAGRRRRGCSRRGRRAIAISCSWNRGTPRVRSSTGTSVGVLVGHRLDAGGPAHVGVHRAALDRPGADERDLDGQVVELARAQPRQGADLGPALDLEDADRSRRGRACRRRRAPPWASSRGPSDSPRCSATSRIMWSSAPSMPRPSRSNFTSPIDSQASLSHCSTVRRSIRARSMGQTSPIGRSVSTMPPEWMPRCRGAPISWSARATTGAGTSWATWSPWSAGHHRLPAVDLLGPGVLLARRVSRAPWPRRAPPSAAGR